MFWEGIFRGIIGAIDGTIYWFIELLLQLVLDLANTQIFSQSVINEFANRIYIILGLVMLFKIIISFIQILINPDKMDDKEQGVGNILMRVVISLILIVLVPSIFSLARQIQSYVIPVIPKVILGTTAGSIDDENSEEFMSTGGRAMAFYTYTAFFNYSDPSCIDGSIYGTGTDPTAVVVYDIGSAVDHIDDVCDETGGYKYNHGFPMSTIVGIFLIFMLVQISIAIAIRAIKLGICEFIAPIPIASYIDPKTSKQAFDNWVSTSIKTYLDLFSRLIIVYFVVFVFMTIVSNENLSIITANLGGDITRQSLVIVALIIGLLQFAKQAPKFISDMLGVKDGMGDIGAMFKGAGAMAATTFGAPFVGSRAAMLARQKSREAGESAEVQRYRARVAARQARRNFVVNRLKGQKFKEGYTSATDKALSKTNMAIQRTGAYTQPGHSATMREVRASNRGHQSTMIKSALGMSPTSDMYDNASEIYSSVNKDIETARGYAEKTKIAKLLSREEAAIQSSSIEGLRSRLRSEMGTLESKARAGTLNSIETDRLNKLRLKFGTQYSPGKYSYNFSNDALIDSERGTLANQANQKYNDYIKETVDAVGDTTKRASYDAKYSSYLAAYGFSGIADMMVKDGSVGTLISDALGNANATLQRGYNSNQEVRNYLNSTGYKNSDGTFKVSQKEIYDDLNAEISHMPARDEVRRAKADKIGVKSRENNNS